MQYNLVGPTPISGFNVPLHEYSSRDKWLLAGFLGLFGGSVAYLFYKKKFSTSNQQQRAPVKQPNRNADDMEFSFIPHLPPEIRTQIWQTLPYQDLLNLRLTSQFTKSDIDTFVGLCGRITTADPQKYDFYQSIALQTCKITELEHPINQDFLLNPNVLQSLEIREHSPIPLDNIRAILSVSINLKSLKLRLTLNGNTQEISQMVLEYLPEMKSLVNLYLKTATRYTPEMKNFSSNTIYYTGPKHLKAICLEMPQLDSIQVSRWKCVLDKQSSVESLICNMGNVHWRLYEQVLRQNSSSIEKVTLEGLRGWDLNRNVEDPFDWSVLSNCPKLAYIDLSCNQGGDHDIMNSVHFETVSCIIITEFFISRITLSPEAVDRVYTEMINLQRGALESIGTEGIDRANELAWLLLQTDDRAHDRWWHDDRLWDAIAHAVFGLTMTLFLSFALKRRADGNFPITTNELKVSNGQGQGGEGSIAN